MDEQKLLVLATALSVAVVVTVFFPAPIWEAESAGYFAPQDSADPANPDNSAEEQPEQREATHIHAYMYFLVDGERKNLSDAYLNQAHKTHFHEDNAVLHKHVTGVTVGEVLDTMEIDANTSCIVFNPENQTLCADDDRELRISINGENMTADAALDHNVEQDDNIVFFYGDRTAEIPENYTEKRLPDKYRQSYNAL